jgi:hypothetical protein
MDEPWHFDRRIPLALIGAILLQTGAAFWWASSINERVVSLESWRQDTKDIAADIAVIKSQIGDMKELLAETGSKAPISGK